MCLYQFCPEGGTAHHDHVVNRAGRKPFHKQIAAQIGTPEARIHDLRHTFAVNSLQCGDDVKTVQGALGHATAAFTLDVYGHVSERMMEEHANRQQEYIKSLGL